MPANDDNADRLIGAERIGAEVRRMARAASLGPVGVTWDQGDRVVWRAKHVLEVFRSSASAIVNLSDAEVIHFPAGPNGPRTNAKLEAMIRDLSRRLLDHTASIHKRRVGG